MKLKLKTFTMHRLDLIPKVITLHKYNSYIFPPVLFKPIQDTIINRVRNVDDTSSSIFILTSVQLAS